LATDFLEKHMRIMLRTKYGRKYFAKLIAMAVRTNIETSQAERLTDAQMRELNPLIRNAIYTVLTALAEATGERGKKSALRWLDRQSMLIPAYVEEPELVESFKHS
jgi:hypothetical protein